MSIIRHRKLWVSISAALVVASIVLLATLGLQWGVDFTGGSLLEVRLEGNPAITDVRTALGELGAEGQVQQTGNDALLIRTHTLDENAHRALLDSLSQRFGKADELKFDSIGPVIGAELRRTATWGVGVTLLLIALYVAWSFRHVSDPVKSWKYGLITIATAFHDVLIPLGAFSLFGHFLGWSVDSAFVAAVLTILGYSIADTVVVFDRTRENLARRVAGSFGDIVDLSIRQTVVRSMNTSITTLLALVAIFLFGGETTRPFAMALIIGIATGAYSSIFLASPLLVLWERKRLS